MIEKKAGITLISLSIAVIIILTITGMILYSAKDSIYIKNLTNMQNDIANLRDKISLYYLEYGEIPVKTEYTNINNLETAGIIGANDTGKFYIIELEKLGGLTLNYGEDYEIYKANGYQYSSDLTNIYIMNEDSHNIFYVEGISVIENGNTQMYYTDYTQGDLEKVEIRIIEGVIIPNEFYYVGGTKDTGIVISDSLNDKNKYKEQETVGTDLEGNQYVWIPVEGILGEDGDIHDIVNHEGQIEKVLLGRYNFNGDGVPSEMSFSNYSEETQEEHSISGAKNTIAQNIDDFIDSVQKYGGYYIARFEDSQNTTTNMVESKYNQTVWTKITQIEAGKICQNLYKDMHSDLINSYAWDTAILFIQKCSGDTDYSKQGRLQDSLTNTGKATDGTNYDIRCNIYDMAGNCYEWTTETFKSNLEFPCMIRGGVYSNSYNASMRISSTIDSLGENLSFRPILYFHN